MRHFALLPVLACACATARLPAPMERWIDAFNRHDVEAMTAEVSPEFEWFMVEGEKVSLETRGVGALRDSMKGYFESLPSARSSVEQVMVSGAYVTLRERASWTGKSGEPKSQSALAVYELREGKLRRAWYFPAER